MGGSNFNEGREAFLKAENRFLLFKNKRGIMESKQP
jgi:hypothetical protein